MFLLPGLGARLFGRSAACRRPAGSTLEDASAQARSGLLRLIPRRFAPQNTVALD